MATIRVRKDERYFTASNEPFQDKRMSWETRGLIGYLLTKPNNWQVRIEDLLKQGPARITKLRRMLAEARMYGYMNRIRVTLDHGKFDWITEVYESPSQNPRPATVRFSTSGRTTSGKPADITITESTSTESPSTAAAQPAPAANPFRAYEQNVGPLTPIISEMIGGLIDDYTSEWVLRAITEAAASNGRSLKYIGGILRGYKERGGPDIGRAPTQQKQQPRRNAPEKVDIDAILGVTHG